MSFFNPEFLTRSGRSVAYNGLQLKEVAVLEHKTVYTHQTLLVAQLFIFALLPPFFLGAVSVSLVLFSAQILRKLHSNTHNSTTKHLGF